MKLVSMIAVILLTLAAANTANADAADVVNPVVSYVDMYGDNDFAPSEIRTLYVENQGRGFTVMHDGPSLTVTTDVDGCSPVGTPITVFANDRNGDGTVDYTYYSPAEWKCADDSTVLTSLPEFEVQRAFGDGVAAVQAAIDAQFSK